MSIIKKMSNDNLTKTATLEFNSETFNPKFFFNFLLYNIFIHKNINLRWIIVIILIMQ